MRGIGITLILLGVGLLVLNLVLSRRKKLRKLEKPAASSEVATALPEPNAPRAPVAEFHVHGNEARVTFDVPLPDEDDEVLNEILVDEAVEVVREKRHSLPIDDVTEIVVFAGKGDPREIGRTKLKAPGELPSPVRPPGFSYTHLVPDPFAAEGETDHGVVYDTKVDVPADELAPLAADLRLPTGLARGLRAVGVDPEAASGPELILALLRMFGYQIEKTASADTYLARKDGLTIFLRTDAYRPGDHPELDDGVINRFLADFSTSRADQGLLVTDKYGPVRVYEIESRQPRCRFLTRERVQRFIDSMALG
ncbi:MAG: hypothetical protein ACE5F5_06420 [Acidimicrobiia bacterium]